VSSESTDMSDERDPLVVQIATVLIDRLWVDMNTRPMAHGYREWCIATVGDAIAPAIESAAHTFRYRFYDDCAHDACTFAARRSRR
jgi:hypothetical protein